jgi:hypothetical protein
MPSELRNGSLGLQTKCVIRNFKNPVQDDLRNIRLGVISSLIRQNFQDFSVKPRLLLALHESVLLHKKGKMINLLWRIHMRTLRSDDCKSSSKTSLS